MIPQCLSWKVTYRSLLAILACLLLSFYFEPYQRGFNCADTSIQNPYRLLLFPTRWLFACTLLLPILFITLVELLSTQVPLRLTSKLTKFTFGFLVNLTLTETAKKVFGRLRPHTYTFCNLAELCPNGAVDQYIDSFTCNNPSASKMYLTNTRLSFYSGHSSLGSFTGTYLVLFLHETLFARFSRFTPLQKVGALLVDVSIFAFYLFPGFTQWLIYWHFATDVLTGYTTGIIYAFLLFNCINRLPATPTSRHSSN